jgi:hypothetical protein
LLEVLDVVGTEVSGCVCLRWFMLLLVDWCCECDKVVTYVVDKYARVRVRVRAVG